MSPEFSQQVLATLDKIDGKIDAIKESLSEHRAGITALETWRSTAMEQVGDHEERLREQEKLGVKVRVYIALVAAAAAASGCAGLVMHYLK